MEEGHLATAIQTEALPVSNPAMEKIFREHYPMVIRAAYRVTGSMEDAEDVAQTVFMRLLNRESDEVAAIDNPGAYLCRSAVNAALDILRHRKSAAQVAIDEAQELPQKTGPYLVGEDRVLSVEVRSWLRTALADINPRAAEMFVLRYVEEKSNKEVAKLMNTSQAVVAVMLHRTRARLQKDFRAYENKKGSVTNHGK